MSDAGPPKDSKGKPAMNYMQRAREVFSNRESGHLSEMNYIICDYLSESCTFRYVARRVV